MCIIHLWLIKLMKPFVKPVRKEMTTVALWEFASCVVDVVWVPNELIDIRTVCILHYIFCKI